VLYISEIVDYVFVVSNQEIDEKEIIDNIVVDNIE
jgi:hypothetical protein